MFLQMGGLEIYGVTEIERFDVPLSFMFPELNDLVTSHEVAALNDPAVCSNGQVHLTIRSWLLRMNNRVILVDGCVGNHKNRKHWPSWHQRTDNVWLKKLGALGVKPQDVDVVFCTHLHADHVGWNTKLENGHWVPTFPNATYLTGRVEYEHWLAESIDGDKHGSFGDSVMPIVEAGQMTFLEDGSDLAHGLDVKLAPGHTPGQLMLHASGCETSAIFCGDVLHSPLQLRFPDISSAICFDRQEAAKTRRKLLSRLGNSEDYLLPSHFSDPGWCKIAAEGDWFSMY